MKTRVYLGNNFIISNATGKYYSVTICLKHDSLVTRKRAESLFIKCTGENNGLKICSELARFLNEEKDLGVNFQYLKTGDLVRLNPTANLGGKSREGVRYFMKLRQIGLSAIMSLGALCLFPISAMASTVTVQPGDTLWKIATAQNISLQALEAANPSIDPTNMLVGTVLTLPAASTNSTTATSEISTSSNTSSQYAQNLYWMEHVIHAEAEGETLQAQIAVGDVVLHRMETPGYPTTVQGVVFQQINGYYQFSCVPNGYIYSTPDAQSIQAAIDVLQNHTDVVPGAYVFFNPAQTPSNSWVWNQPRIASIDNFIFCS